MKQNRQTKMVAILALCVAVLGLTIGFAAFTNTLTIKSSATVSPDSSDFKMTIYGLNEDLDKIWSDDYIFNVSNYNKNFGYCYSEKSGCDVAIIDNETTTISNISANYTIPGDDVIYYFMVKNESDYKVYLDMNDYFNFDDNEAISLSLPKICTTNSENETSRNLVDKACNDIALVTAALDSNGDGITSPIVEIEKDDFIIFYVLINYEDNGNVSDVPFSATFDDIKLNFSTMPPTE